MSLRFPLVAAAVLVGTAFLASPVFAIETIHIPDSSTPNNAMPPDGLFDDSVPATWHKKSDLTDSQSNQTGIGGFHFSVNSSSGQQQSTTSYGDPRTPGSEFYQPMQGYSPYMPR
jgi:hypothetical protein